MNCNGWRLAHARVKGETFSRALRGCPVGSNPLSTSWPARATARFIPALRQTLVKRGWEHRSGAVGGFASRYACKILVWYELGGDMHAAITREKQIKAGSRAKKLSLIETQNPDWRDLWPDIAHP
jgi:putative endonuclease